MYGRSRRWISTASTYRVICNVAEKALIHERILDEPVLCVALPLCEPAPQDERNQLYDIPLTYSEHISTKGNTQLDGSRAASRASCTASGLGFQRHAGRLLILPAE